MEYFLSEEQQMIKDLARQIAQEKISPVAVEHDEKQTFPNEIIKILGESDLFAVAIPEAYGGMGLKEFGSLLVIEALSYACAGITLTYIESLLGVYPILLAGSEAQKQKYLPDVARGKALFSFALAEQTAGSDASAVKLSAQKVSNGYVLNGTKHFVTTGGYADFYTIFAVTQAGKGNKGISCFVIPKNAKGLTFGAPLQKMGVNASPTTSMTLESVELSEDQRIGSENDGFRIAMQAIDHSRPMIAAQAIGIAQSALDKSAKYATERKQFNRPIADFEGLQFMLAQMDAKIEISRNMLYAVGKMLDQGLTTTRESAIVKLMASDAAMQVTTDAIQIFGGYGYMREYPVEKLFRDAKITQIYAGTNQILQLIVAKHLLTQFASKEYQWSIA